MIDSIDDDDRSFASSQINLTVAIRCSDLSISEKSLLRAPSFFSMINIVSKTPKNEKRKILLYQTPPFKSSSSAM